MPTTDFLLQHDSPLWRTTSRQRSPCNMRLRRCEVRWCSGTPRPDPRGWEMEVARGLGAQVARQQIFLTPYGPPFRASGVLSPSKTSKRWCLILSGATGDLEKSRVRASVANGHSKSDYSTCLPLALSGMPSKRRPVKLDTKLGSTT